MISKVEKRDNLKQSVQHIAFVINKEGIIEYGLAGEVAFKYWPELVDCGSHELGEVISKQVGNTTFHAMVTYSIEEGWPKDQSQIIRNCLNKIDSNGQPIATTLIGNDFAGKMTGADCNQIIRGMIESNQEIELYAGYPLNTYQEENSKKVMSYK